MIKSAKVRQKTKRLRKSRVLGVFKILASRDINLAAVADVLTDHINRQWYI